MAKNRFKEVLARGMAVAVVRYFVTELVTGCREVFWHYEAIVRTSAEALQMGFVVEYEMARYNRQIAIAKLTPEEVRAFRGVADTADSHEACEHGEIWRFNGFDYKRKGGDDDEA